MKNLKAKLISVFAMLVAMIAISSCVNTEGGNPTYYQEIVTISVADEGNTVSFSSTKGRYLATAMPTGLDITKYDGCRALLYYSVAERTSVGYDKVVNVAAISISDTKYGVETASTAEQLAAFGSETTTCEQTDTHLQGYWLDMMVTYFTNDEITNEFTLVAPDPSIVTPAVSVPDGYLYLELRQKVNKEFSKVQQSKTMISFRLPSEYCPEDMGYKGIYLRLDTGGSTPNYIKIENVSQ